jgi:hypothetical protein
MLNSVMPNAVILSTVMLNASMLNAVILNEFQYAECHYAECYYINALMLNVIKLKAKWVSPTDHISFVPMMFWYVQCFKDICFMTIFIFPLIYFIRVAFIFTLYAVKLSPYCVPWILQWHNLRKILSSISNTLLT